MKYISRLDGISCDRSTSKQVSWAVIAVLVLWMGMSEAQAAVGSTYGTLNDDQDMVAASMVFATTHATVPSTKVNNPYSLNESSSYDSPVLLAQSSRSRRRKALENNADNTENAPRDSRRSRKNKKKKGTRVMTSEKSVRVKGGALMDTNIDFDEADITGQRRSPNIGFVKSTVGESGRNFIKVRKEWHDAMVQSTLLVD
ncbi:MAG: hypothetical protein OXC44_07180 [Proteobacteria bacterium]|nr:hypothetical protein [Pseudomonadota bacterium]